jgi:hypothetical protein
LPPTRCLWSGSSARRGWRPSFVTRTSFRSTTSATTTVHGRYNFVAAALIDPPRVLAGHSGSSWTAPSLAVIDLDEAPIAVSLVDLNEPPTVRRVEPYTGTPNWVLTVGGRRKIRHWSVPSKSGEVNLDLKHDAIGYSPDPRLVATLPGRGASPVGTVNILRRV